MISMFKVYDTSDKDVINEQNWFINSNGNLLFETNGMSSFCVLLRNQRVIPIF